MVRDATPAIARRHPLVLVAGAGLAVGYFITWDLWSARTTPPNLPAVHGLAGVHFGIALVAAALLAARWPRAGATAHAGLLLAAVLGDQVRLQPGFVSLAILLVAGAWGPAGLALGRWHVLTLWGWSGLNKVLSLGWSGSAAAFIANAAHVPGLRPVVAVVVPLLEMALAVLALRPRAWRLLRVAGPVFHIGIVVLLALEHWNRAVWPWNLALAAAVPLLFRAPTPAPDQPSHASPGTRVVAAVLVLYPLGFYAGVVDAYLSHNLYTDNTAVASICATEESTFCLPAPMRVWAGLQVPFPPERRLYVDWLAPGCLPGEWVRIDGIRTRVRHGSREHVACAGAPVITASSVGNLPDTGGP